MKRKKLLSGILALSCALTLLPAAPVSAAEPRTGTFTAVSMNVDGLPTDLLGFININEGGPGPDGTRAIGQKMAEYGWDIIGVSEDFNYNDELMEALSEDYNAGTHRGGVSWLTNDTDRTEPALEEIPFRDWGKLDKMEYSVQHRICQYRQRRGRYDQ